MTSGSALVPKLKLKGSVVDGPVPKQVPTASIPFKSRANVNVAEPPDEATQALHLAQLRALLAALDARPDGAEIENRVRGLVAIYVAIGTPRQDAPFGLDGSEGLRVDNMSAAAQSALGKVKGALQLRTDRVKKRDQVLDYLNQTNVLSMTANVPRRKALYQEYELDEVPKLEPCRIRDTHEAVIRQIKDDEQPEEDERVVKYDNMINKSGTLFEALRAGAGGAVKSSRRLSTSVSRRSHTFSRSKTSSPIATPDRARTSESTGSAPSFGLGTDSAMPEQSTADSSKPDQSAVTPNAAGSVPGSEDLRREASARDLATPPTPRAEASAQLASPRSADSAAPHEHGSRPDSPASAASAVTFAPAPAASGEHQIVDCASEHPAEDEEAPPSSPTRRKVAIAPQPDTRSADRFPSRSDRKSRSHVREPSGDGAAEGALPRAMSGALKKDGSSISRAPSLHDNSPALAKYWHWNRLAEDFSDGKNVPDWQRARDLANAVAKEEIEIKSKNLRRLARRESDIMWVNIAKERGEQVSLQVDLKRPNGIKPEAWKRMTDEQRRLALGLPYTPDILTVQDPRRRAVETRAALTRIAEVNSVGFNDGDAVQQDELLRMHADRAQTHLSHLAEGINSNTALLEQKYRESLIDISRCRPVYRPCLSHLNVPRESYRAAKGVSRTKVKWTLTTSNFFVKRKQTAESKDFGDMENIYMQQFEIDWSRVVNKKRFQAMIGRSNKAELAGNASELQRELNEVKAALQQHKLVIVMMFLYYSNIVLGKWASTDALEIHLDTFRIMVEDIGLIDPSARTCRNMNELDAVFVATNFEEAGGGQMEDMGNDDNALVQFEFYEVIVRLAFAKYIQSKDMSDASDAVDRLMMEYMLPNLPNEALVDPNEFRFTRMYTEQVDRLLTKFEPFLSATFRVYKAQNKSKYLWPEHFKHFLDNMKLLDPHDFNVTEHEARFIFYWSQSLVRDELKNRQRKVSIIFFDFCEVICRLADATGLPTAQDLAQFYGGEKRLPPSPWTDYVDTIGRGNEIDVDLDLREGTPRRNFVASLSTAERNWLQPQLVHVPLERSESSDNLFAKKVRPLHSKLESFIEYTVARMRETWGGKDCAECTQRMNDTSQALSGGIEIS